MSVLVLASIAAFVLANVWVEAINEGVDMHWYERTLSDYLFGLPGSRVLSVAYGGLVAGETLLIFNQPRGTSATACLAVAAAGLLGVVVTANIAISTPAGEWIQRVHYVLAGFAFTGGVAAEVVILWPGAAVTLVVGGVVTTLALLRWIPERPALAEKALTAWLLAGMLAIVVPAI